MTDIAQQLKSLRLPAFAAPMFLVSTPELVVNVCRAGMIGSFPAPNLRTSEELGEWMARISKQTKQAAFGPWNVAPWAVNLVTHSTSVRLPGDLEQIKKYKPPIVITALGSPKPVIPTVHNYGGLVFADVNSEAMARKAAAAGADGLVLVCTGAGGHTGDLTPFAFVERVRQFFDGFIALGGGISRGEAILAAQALGADFGYLGTAFIAAEESMAEAGYKEMLVDCTAQDLLVTRAFTGAKASMLVPSIVAQGLDPQEVATKIARMQFTGLQDQEVKPWKGIWGAGQGVGAVTCVEPAEAIVERLATQYRTAKARMGMAV